MPVIKTVEELNLLYGAPRDVSLAKVAPLITPEYRRMIELSPFAILASSGPEGLDCSPRGDKSGFVRVQDERTLLLPDRRGNNRVDSLANIVRDGRIALLFLLPGSGTTLRVNGTAVLETEDALRESFAIEEKAPRCVVVITVAEVYFQCARAIIRSALWDSARHIPPEAIPSTGQILASMSQGKLGGEKWDREWPERAAASMW
ncbi:MAG: pyridoxamine 5'-phosphate oxidase family protein [Acetobacteraceae bacterium]|nr:pyridoxamine 5'-phosphate oxidase family protein [Acetobacteraceae bacterium]